VQRYILTLACPDQPGIIRALAEGVTEFKGNILESSQFSDPSTGIFAIRVALETPESDPGQLRDEIALRLGRFDPVLALRPEEQRCRLLLMVSRLDHCHTPDELVAIGRDVERVVLARAVKLYAEDRVVLTGSRTVVFT
jgi:formyltetrahydrofolate deformylase